MKDAQTNADLGYQEIFRLIGQYLDGARPARFTVLEMKSGFHVILDDAGEPEYEEIEFEREGLPEMISRQRRRRRREERDPSVWAAVGTTRQDFLRALGYELDEVGAAYVGIDELDDRILLTYSHLNPAGALIWSKRLLVLGRPEVDEILKARSERRAPRFWHL